ncbi:MAG: InlB B-repeat-containing protein [Leptospirales bacterium]|nr:InlB B-repeat-containing protein [Leptospirales bacterium]
MKNILKTAILFLITGIIFISCDNPFLSDSDSYVHRGTYFFVKFEPYGGEPSPGAQKIAYGTKVSKISPVNRSGFGFAGWYSDAELTKLWDFATNTVTSDMTLFAKWNRLTFYKVKFELNGGNPRLADQEVAEGTKVTEPSPIRKTDEDKRDPDNPDDLEKEHAIKPVESFAGWYSDAAFTRPWNFAVDTVTSDMTLYAKWDDGPEYCNIVLEANGGSPVPRKQEIAWGAKIVEPLAMNKTGEGFGGWYTDKDCTRPWNFAADIVSASMSAITVSSGTYTLTLYAKWVRNDYTVKFEANGGTPAPADQEIPYGYKAAKPPIISKSAFGFIGWYKDSSFTDEWDFDRDTVSAHMTLYAKWETAHHTIKFETYGGTPVPADQDITWGKKAAEPPMPDRGFLYGFDGWYTEPEYTNQWDFDTDAVYDNDIVLHAKWVYVLDFLPDMVWVPPGSYMMGNDHVSGAKPAHKVKLSGFFIGRYPVTQEKYLDVMKVSNPSSFQAGRIERPVDRVSWYDAIKFCNELSDQKGLERVYEIDDEVLSTGHPVTIISATVTVDWTNNGYRLPTEAEWEYAARGGNGSPGNFTYSGSNNPDEVAWYNQNSGSMTIEVGRLSPNNLWIWDMSGNISEWCWDFFDSKYYETSPFLSINPSGPNSGDARVRRGGSWNNAYTNVTTTTRNSQAPGNATYVNGFRVVCRP